MRILVVSPCFPPLNSNASLRVHAFARAWADEGETVTVLTTAKTPRQQGLEADRAGMEVVEIGYAVPGVLRFLRRRDRESDGGSGRRLGAIGMRPLRGIRERTGVLGSARMPDLTDSWVRPALSWSRDRGPWDVVVSSSGPYTAHLVALDLRRRGIAARWVADFRDLWTANHVWPGLFPFTLRERALERACLAAADRVWTVSRELAATLAQRTRAPADVIYNGYERAELAALPPEPVFPDDGRVRLVYTGTLYPAGQDPRALLGALARLRARRPRTASRLSLVVRGHGHERWRRLAGTALGAMLDARPPVDRATALRMQRDAGALVLVDWGAPNSGVLTGKLFEYLAATAPILLVGGGRESSIDRILQRARRGVNLGSDECRIEEQLAALVESPPPHPDADRDYIAGFERRRQALRGLELIRDGVPVGACLPCPAQVG